MKTATLSKLILIMLVTGALFSCKKSTSTSTATTDADLQTQSDDQTRVSTETDAAFDDVNTAMVGETGVSGAGSAPGARHIIPAGPGGQDTISTTICDAVVTADSSARTMTITYNGKNCSLSRTRTGSILITFPQGTQWRDKGAMITVQFNNLAITRLLDNKTIMLNGAHTYANVSGGSLIDLPNMPGDSIVHSITSSDMSITFDNGTKRSWNVARQRSFTYNDGFIVSCTGAYTDGNSSGVTMWGQDRFGNTFTTAIIRPIVIAQNCSWQFTAGQAALSTSAGTLTLTYGLNASGSPIACPISSVYYFQLVWAGSGGKTYTYTLPY